MLFATHKVVNIYDVKPDPQRQKLFIPRCPHTLPVSKTLRPSEDGARGCGYCEALSKSLFGVASALGHLRDTIILLLLVLLLLLEGHGQDCIFSGAVRQFQIYIPRLGLGN